MADYKKRLDELKNYDPFNEHLEDTDVMIGNLLSISYELLKERDLLKEGLEDMMDVGCYCPDCWHPADDIEELLSELKAIK